MKKFLFIMGLMLSFYGSMYAMLEVPAATLTRDSGREGSPQNALEGDADIALLALSQVEKFSEKLEGVFDRINGLQERMSFLQKRLAMIQKMEASSLNMFEDLLRRISELEEVVFEEE